MDRQNQIHKTFTEGRTKRVTPNKLYKIIFGVIIITALAFIIYLPRTEFFKGALVETREIEKPAPAEKGTIVVEYIKDADEKEVAVGEKEVSLWKTGFKVGNEPVAITGISIELEGADANAINPQKVLADGKGIKNAEFKWTTASSFFIDFSTSSLIIDEYAEIEILGEVLENESEYAALHIVDITGEGTLTGEKISSLGVNGMLDPMPQILRLKAL